VDVKRGVGVPNNGGAIVGVIDVGQGAGSDAPGDVALGAVELPVVEPTLLVALAGMEFVLVTTVVLVAGLHGVVRPPA
jgi:hypothetical protein